MYVDMTGIAIEIDRLRMVKERDELLKMCNDCEIIEVEFESFYDSVMDVICKLGGITNVYGHSKESDWLKDNAFKLLGL
jgi:hypothetical protein